MFHETIIILFIRLLCHQLIYSWTLSRGIKFYIELNESDSFCNYNNQYRIWFNADFTQLLIPRVCVGGLQGGTQDPFWVLAFTCSFPCQSTTDTWSASSLIWEVPGGSAFIAFMLNLGWQFSYVVSPAQTTDNGGEPSDLAFTPVALALSLSQSRSTGWALCNDLIY